MHGTIQHTKNDINALYSHLAVSGDNQALIVFHWGEHYSLWPITYLGSTIHLVDHLSRNFSLNQEWSLKPGVLQSIFAVWGILTIDLFTMRDKKCQLFCYQSRLLE